MTLEEIKTRIQENLPDYLGIYTPEEDNAYLRKLHDEGYDVWDVPGPGEEQYLLVTDNLEKLLNDEPMHLMGAWIVESREGNFYTYWMNPDGSFDDLEEFIKHLKEDYKIPIE